jgi:hypothetical protein
MIAVAAAIHRLSLAEGSELAGAVKVWTRPDLRDLAATATLTWMVLQIWDYILTNL